MCSECRELLEEPKWAKTPKPKQVIPESEKAERAMFEPVEKCGPNASEAMFEFFNTKPETYLREESLEIKPIMVIMAVRRIPEVQEALERIRHVDKVFFRNYTP